MIYYFQNFIQTTDINMKTLLKTAFFTIFFVLVSACSSGTTTSSTPPNLSGATFTGSIIPGTFSARSIEITLIQDDAGALTGTFIVRDFDPCLEGGTIAGNIDGTSVSLTISDTTDAVLTFTGTASNNSIEGNFTADDVDVTCGNFSGSISVTR